MGVDPDPYSLAELVDMLEGRQREQWQHTATLECAIFNASGNLKEVMKVADRYPFDRPEPVIADMGMVMSMFDGD